MAKISNDVDVKDIRENEQEDGIGRKDGIKQQGNNNVKILKVNELFGATEPTYVFEVLAGEYLILTGKHRGDYVRDPIASEEPTKDEILQLLKIITYK